MPKKNILVKISDHISNDTIFETNAIFQDDMVKYKEDESNITIYNYKNNTLKRENNSIIINAKFIENEETEWLITIKDIGKTVSINVKTIGLEVNGKNIKIKYIIEGNIFSYSLEVK